MGSKQQKSKKAEEYAAFGRRNIVETFGVKITSAQREYYRYTGVSAEVERHGMGSNLHDFTRIPSGERDRHDSQ
jgi:hypothetical protein